MKKAIFITIGCLAVLIFSSFTIAYAVEEQFNITATVVTNDTTAPSVPTGLTATAVSSSQVDLSWSASTDNVAVTGYRIYRDSAFIGTAVSTNYSDIGLTASTAYDYTVTAIDGALNESAHSATSTATTFAQTTTVTPTPGSTTGQSRPIIYDLVIVPTQTGATISWKTTAPTIGNLTWGLTSNNELGSSAGTLYELNHSVQISGLIPATTYSFSIEAISGYGIKVNLDNQQFTTLSLPEGNLNPTNFTATARQSDILLAWKNPVSPTFSEVRLVRSKNFFPTDPSDGEVIYEGTSEGMVDKNVEVGVTYYYALFAKDTNGTYSSGSLASARIRKAGEPSIPTGDIVDTIPQAQNVHPLIQALTFLDFDFMQGGKKITSVSGGDSVTIDGSKNLTVSLDYKKVPEVLKSIVVTLIDPTDSEKTFTFLLRVNPEKTAYTATIAPLGRSGTYGVKISIVDYKNQGLKRIVGNLLAIASAGIAGHEDLYKQFILYIEENSVNLIFLLILLLILIKAFRMVFAKKKQKEVKQNNIHTFQK